MTLKLEERIDEAENSGLTFQSEGPSGVRLIRNPSQSPLNYEEISISPSTGNVTYFSILPNQFMDTFLEVDEDYLKVQFIRRAHEDAKKTHNSRETAGGLVGRDERVQKIIHISEHCSEDDMRRVVDFFISKSREKKNGKNFYERLNELTKGRYLT